MLHTMTMAIHWQPELRGISAVLIAAGVLCGSVYLLLGTNLGARLGMLVALAGLMGWMVIMGSIWWVYGIGLRGKDPTWKEREVIVGELKNSRFEFARSLDTWKKLADDDPSRGQAQASSDDILVNQAKALKSGQYLTIDVYEIGGHTWPDWFFNFKHDPKYAIVNVQPVVPQNTEPGKAPPTPVADKSQPAYHVLMERDLGNRRRPAALITLGSLAIFAALASMLHSRDKKVWEARGLPTSSKA